MNVDVVLAPAEIDGLPGRNLQETTCVIFDVLRATSSMLTALAHGAEEIHPARTVDEARGLKRSMPDALMGGERHGERIEGFDVGNSPLEYVTGMPRRIISTTTNGTVAIRACEHAQRVVIGALLNMATLARALQSGSPRLLLVCAGTFRDPALEDIFAAGMLCSHFSGAAFSDSALTAQALFQRYAADPFSALAASRNGRVLLGKGRTEEVRWCAQVSRFDVLGLLTGAAIRHAP
jgi:2-phosphosulfolactate phosphatase